jgi:hypothetical protein
MPGRFISQYISTATSGHIISALSEHEVAERIERMRDDEEFDLNEDVHTPLADRLRAQYAALLTSDDPAQRELAEVQLHRLEGRPYRHGAADPPHLVGSAADLVALVEAVVGPLHERANGSYDGHCPWHGSRSGTCLAIFRGDEGEWRWYCRSCRRSGDAVHWLTLTAGITFGEARRRLGLPARARTYRPPARHSPPRIARTLSADWRPSAVTLPEHWHPGDPLPDRCRP